MNSRNLDLASGDNLFTLRDFFRYAVSQFSAAKLVFGHGSDSAYDEAAHLCLRALSLPPEHLEPFLDARLLPEEKEKILQLVQKRVQQRLPLAYLLQEAWLAGLSFYVDQRTCIPRSLLGELLQEQLSPWLRNPDQIYNILELCTGGASLAIIAALAFPNAQIDAVDISAEALAVAQKNCSDYQLRDRIHLFEGDLYQPLEQRVYDLIFANPPYVNALSMQHLPAEYLSEPHLALAGGVDGMDCVRKILQNARNFLSATGLLVIEIGHEAKNFEQAFPTLNFVWLNTQTAEKQIVLIHAEDMNLVA